MFPEKFQIDRWIRGDYFLHRRLRAGLTRQGSLGDEWCDDSNLGDQKRLHKWL